MCRCWRRYTHHRIQTAAVSSSRSAGSPPNQVLHCPPAVEMGITTQTQFLLPVTTQSGIWWSFLLLFQERRRQDPYLSVVGNGLFVFLNDVFWTQAVLRPSDLGAGVGADAVGGQGACTQEERGKVRWDQEAQEVHWPVPPQGQYRW